MVFQVQSGVTSIDDAARSACPSMSNMDGNVAWVKEFICEKKASLSASSGVYGKV
jgi:hypothetical protein